MEKATNKYDLMCGKCNHYDKTECPLFEYRLVGLGVKDAAAKLNRAEQTIYNWKNLGKIQCTKPGGKLIFPLCQIMFMLNISDD